MAVKRVGFVGWRGMVGSVLIQRMQEEGDFALIDEPEFYTTSQVGQAGPDIGKTTAPLKDAMDIASLSQLDVIVTCQGGDYTSTIHSELIKQDWEGYWIDAASTLRMDDDAIIVLDPVNLSVIECGLDSGVKKKLIGGNCTVSLMLMGLGGLFNAGAIEWMTAMTYQAASGSGAKHMRELIVQMGEINSATADLLANPASGILQIDQAVTDTLHSKEFSVDNWKVPLAGSLIPWIDSDLDNGVSREEWKAPAETNKILGHQDDALIPIDGLCVRIGAMRCHAQAVTIKLKQDIPLDEIEAMLGEENEWVEIIANQSAPSQQKLTPAYATGTRKIPVGRLRKMQMGGQYLSAFTVGDQLLWGAAEPLRRVLRILLER